MLFINLESKKIILFFFKRWAFYKNVIVFTKLFNIFFSHKNTDKVAVGVFFRKKFRRNVLFKFSKKKFRSLKNNFLKCSYFSIFFKEKFFMNKKSKLNLRLNQLIFLRKKTNYMKRHFRYNRFLLKKLYFLQKIFTKKHFLKNHKFQWKTKRKTKIRTYLGSKKQYRHFRNSRNFFKEFSTWKTKKWYDIRHWKFSRPVRKQSRQPAKVYLYANDNSLLNLILKCKIAFIHHDALSLIDSGLIKVNFKSVRNPELVLSKGDLIQFPISNKYYTNVWKYENFSFSKLNHLGYRLWRIYRLRHDLYKQQYDRDPELYHLRNMYFNLPSHIELDFKTMTMYILKDVSCVYSLNYFDIKYVNLSCITLYNWKYVV